MHFPLKLAILFFALLGFTVMGNAKEDDPTKIRQVLKADFPQLTIEEITPSPVKGLYQVTANGNVLYVTSDAHYALSGDMIDLEHAQANLTEDYRKKMRLKGLKALGSDNMIIFSPLKPKYTVTVFTDVDCGYCRKLQSDIGKLNSLGIAIRYLAFPRGGPNTPTYNKMVSIWCAKDKKQALALATLDKTVENNICANNTVSREFQYGVSIGVTGTPTLIFEDGTLVPGYLPPEKMLEVAEQLAKK